MIFKRPNIVCKLECINKFSVVVHYQFEKHFFKKNSLSLFMKAPFLGTPPILLAFLHPPMQTIWESHMSSLRKFGRKV